MGRQSQYSILVDAELNLKDLENQLKELEHFYRKYRD